MRHLLLLVFLLTACTAIETTKCPEPKPREPQCPFGQPVTKYDAVDMKIAPIIVQRDQYTLAYDPDKRVPVWVCETVSANELTGPAERKSNHPMDPLIGRQYQSSSATYTGWGYDRGHLIPAANQLWNQKYSDETFYMSNVAPMSAKFNRGVWRQFEDWIRKWVMKNGDAYVITGTINTAPHELRVVLKEEVEVPTHFYKILVSKGRAIGFVFNVESVYKAPYDWQAQVVAIDLIEEMTNLDFMPLLTMKKETELERVGADFSQWK